MDQPFASLTVIYPKEFFELLSKRTSTTFSKVLPRLQPNWTSRVSPSQYNFQDFLLSYNIPEQTKTLGTLKWLVGIPLKRIVTRKGTTLTGMVTNHGLYRGRKQAADVVLANFDPTDQNSLKEILGLLCVRLGSLSATLRPPLLPTPKTSRSWRPILPRKRPTWTRWSRL